MRILFVTGLYPHAYIDDLRMLSNGCIQNASNVFQWAVVDGLFKNKVEFEVLSFPFLPSFPLNYKKVYTPMGSIIIDGCNVGEMVSYCDLLVYKTLSIQLKCEIKIREWLEKNKDYNGKLVILTYSPYPPFLKAIKKLKKIYPNVIVASIITDLADNMMDFKSNRSFLKRIQCYKQIKETKSLYKYIDKFILLASPMIEKIPEAVNKHIIIEGISVHKEYINSLKSEANPSILYTGTLEEFSGVGYLIEAFKKVTNKNVSLIICGTGSLAKQVEDATKIDKRIIYKGLVTREEALLLQNQATILINPRRPDGEITRFSFPSKTMEYLSSGTPMIGYKLEGIPSEYYDYYYTIDDLSEDSLINTIEDVLSRPMSELETKACSAFKFIMTNKTARVQVKKILYFMKY